MQSSAAMRSASRAISRAGERRCGAAARAPRRARSCRRSRSPSRPSSSGWSRSPVPETRKLLLGVGDDHHRLELAQHAVGAPVLGELDDGALEILVELLELGLEAGEEREPVGGAAGEADQHLALAGALDLARRPALMHRVAEGDLPVGGHARRARRGAPAGRSSSAFVASDGHCINRGARAPGPSAAVAERRRR